LYSRRECFFSWKREGLGSVSWKIFERNKELGILQLLEKEKLARDIYTLQKEK
jgi:hypothetical protein